MLSQCSSHSGSLFFHCFSLFFTVFFCFSGGGMLTDMVAADKKNRQQNAPVAAFCLLQEVMDVVFDGALGDRKNLRDLLVCLFLQQLPKDFPFSGRQSIPGAETIESLPFPLRARSSRSRRPLLIYWIKWCSRSGFIWHLSACIIRILRRLAACLVCCLRCLAACLVYSLRHLTVCIVRCS